MNHHSIKLVALSAAVSIAGLVVAAEPASAPKPTMPMHQHMVGGSMMDMMGSCQSMMGSGGMSGSAGMPKLPPGNEKLEAQMHAEMMQKMGEIAARYAEKIKESR